MKIPIFQDRLHRILYATDASAYFEMPMGVAYPKEEEDLRDLITYARDHKISLIPRAGGTSLAGQVVGNGLVIDVSRYMNQILELNSQEGYVRVQAGVVLEELNLFLKPYGLFFGPETSTSSRCCLGGMVGNNSCGSHSLVYGSTREHLLEATVLLSDGSKAVFASLSAQEVACKSKENTLEGRIYAYLSQLLSVPENVEEIYQNFPDLTLTRRNTAYALDELLKDFNLCKLLAGSEGTLALISELKLKVVPLPAMHKALLCVHCSSLPEAFEVNIEALLFKPLAIELMDHHILEMSKLNLVQSKNRFFIKGNPQALLLIEVGDSMPQGLERQLQEMEQALTVRFPDLVFTKVYEEKIAQVWALRKAALGLLSNRKGEALPVSVVEDTAVPAQRLPAYMADFAAMLQDLNLSCVYHAHIGSGELHLRPVLDLKQNQQRLLFREVAYRTALLVKKHKGSLSGEHGDGRLRGEFIPLMFGNKIYQWFREIKYVFDPEQILNRGKIVDTPPMDKCLRYEQAEHSFPSFYFRYKHLNLLAEVEACSGSADCRKSAHLLGNMCPVFRTTQEEVHSTRARANVLRELLLHPQTSGIFDQEDMRAILDSCLACKACKSECPANIDMARYKSEFLGQFHRLKGMDLRTFLVGYLPSIQAMASLWPSLYNRVIQQKWSGAGLKKILNFDLDRKLPILAPHTCCRVVKQEIRLKSSSLTLNPSKSFYFFIDEFTQYMDVQVGFDFVELMQRLGYQVRVMKYRESGRTALSKGIMKRAKNLAQSQVEYWSPLISSSLPLVGLEPSCILAFRDEYPDLVEESWKKKASDLAQHTYLFDEYLQKEVEKGNINASHFTKEEKHIYLHGHCHQKAWVGMEASQKILSLPQNYHVYLVQAACCGMAGSFGYEKEHSALSVQVAEAELMPALRKAQPHDVIAAPGSSCRQQIQHILGRQALHPVQILKTALQE